MGLSAPKKRTKISNDPNNLAWAKATDSFGHKILTSKGWKPGEYLGARDAAHAEHYTAANAASIRVTLREDGLGLGAQIGKGNAETFGLSMFSGLLGRLNGKSDKELEAQQSAQRDVELRMYQSQKYGTMNFVYGGLLVGDKIEDRKLKEMGIQSAAKSLPATETAVAEKKKRKAEDDVERNEDSSARTKKQRKKEKKRHGKDEESGEEVEVEPDTSKASSVKKSKKSKPTGEVPVGHEPADAESLSKVRKSGKKAGKLEKRSETDDEKSRLKQDKRARKEERRKRKEEKRRKRAEKESVASESPVPSSTGPGEEEGILAPSVSTRIALATGNRYAVRHRYIQQKRMASLNPQALKEIFMLQAAS